MGGMMRFMVYVKDRPKAKKVASFYWRLQKIG